MCFIKTTRSTQTPLRHKLPYLLTSYNMREYRENIHKCLLDGFSTEKI